MVTALSVSHLVCLALTCARAHTRMHACTHTFRKRPPVVWWLLPFSWVRNRCIQARSLKTVFFFFCLTCCGLLSLAQALDTGLLNGFLPTVNIKCVYAVNSSTRTKINTNRQNVDVRCLCEWVTGSADYAQSTEIKVTKKAVLQACCQSVTLAREHRPLQWPEVDTKQISIKQFVIEFASQCCSSYWEIYESHWGQNRFWVECLLPWFQCRGKSSILVYVGKRGYGSILCGDNQTRFLFNTE